jgi:NitT/TauT family transport system substrate-binding protein
LAALTTLAACGSSGGGSNSNTTGNAGTTAAGNGGSTAGESTGAGGGSGSLTDITVGVVPYSPDAILWYGIDGGIFKKHGLNVKTESAASPIAIAAAMASGKQQFGFTTTPVLINANISGAGQKCVTSVAGQSSPKDPTALVVPKNSKVKSLKDLKGKTIAEVQLGSLNRLAMQVLLKRAGVDNNDVKHVAIPFPQMPQALASGRVDAAVIVDPFLETAIKAGGRVIVQPNAELYAGGTIVCFAATDKYLEGHADVANKFRAAMDESLAYFKTNPKDVLKTLVKYLKLSPEAAQNQKIETNYNPELNVKSIGMIQQQMKDFGWIKKTVDPKTMVWSPSM